MEKLFLTKKMIVTSIVSSFLIIILQFFQWELIEFFTPFLMVYVWLLVYAGFFIMIILSIFHLVKNKKMMPLLIHLITVLLLFTVPFNRIVIDRDFNSNKSERMEVVANVQKGIFTPNISYNPSLIHLPDEYESLSAGGGDIMIEKQEEGYFILFFTFRGILDNFSGFVYSPDDKKPSPGLYSEDYQQIKKMERNWYYVSSS